MARGADSLSAANGSWALARGADDWDAGRFFDAHEAWEGVWIGIRGTPEGDRWKGAIAMAGAFHHLSRGRTEPARRLLLRAIELLRPSGDSTRDRWLEDLSERARSALLDLGRGQPVEALARSGRFPSSALSSDGTEATSVG